MPLEVITVADDEVVAFDGPEVVRLGGLTPDRGYDIGGTTARTLARPPGERLATVATVNDTHFGEVRCGHIEGSNLGPVLSAEPGGLPYPEVMNNAAASEIESTVPDLVVAKGDITDAGRPEEWAAFRRCYQARFGERLVFTLGNHDVAAATSAHGVAPPAQAVSLPGVTLAVLDTSVAGIEGGRLSTGQLEWLDDLASRADRPVLVLGHHPVKGGRKEWWEVEGLDQASSSALVELVGRRPAIVAYLAGHTHRNRVQRFPSTGAVPWVEVACAKDFPGSWAEYRVFEGGILQVHRRVSSPEALRWSEKCRSLFGGLYPAYALGSLSERCLPIWPRW
jgi:predicted phosphodiesterase